MTGTMLKTVKLLGTSLALHKGDRVWVMPAGNQPNSNWFEGFAQPIDLYWSDGIIRSDDDSILVDRDNVLIDNPRPRKGH